MEEKSDGQTNQTVRTGYLLSRCVLKKEKSKKQKPTGATRRESVIRRKSAESESARKTSAHNGTAGTGIPDGRERVRTNDGTVFAAYKTHLA
jgi:hypothetical protein